VPQPNYVVQCGMAKEPSWGTATVPPTVSISVDQPVFQEDDEPIPDTGLRGNRAMTQNIAFGQGATMVNLPNMPWYGDDSVHWLMAFLGTDTVTGAARTGTLSAVAVGATTATYTPGTGGASVTGDIFVIDAGLPTQEIVVPTSIAANVWTVPATGLNSFKFAHAGGAAVKTLFQHVLTLSAAIQPSYTGVLFDNLVATCKQVTGIYFDQFDLKIANPGKTLASMKGLGQLGSLITKPVFPAYSSELFFDVPWQTSFVVAGVANARFTGFDLAIKAKVDQIFGMNGTRSATSAMPAPIQVEGTALIVPDDYTEYTYYLNNVQPTLVATMDTGSTRTVLQMSKFAFKKPTTLDHAGNFTTIKATWEAVANSTDAGSGGNSPLKAIIWNSRSGAY